jgi:hypothetical protein
MAWAPDYITTAELKSFLLIDDTNDDNQLAVAITAASSAINRFCGRQFGKVDSAELRTYTARWDRHRVHQAWVVDIDDVATTSGAIVTVNGTAVTDYKLEPRNAVAKGKVWTELVFGRSAEAFPTVATDHEVDITMSWGWPAFPVAIQQATYLQASRFHARRDSPYGVAGSPQDGSELRLLANLDPDVQVSLNDYVRRWGAVSGPVPAAGHPHYPWGWGGWSW